MTHKRKIAFVVGNRAHFARVRPIIKHMRSDEYRVIIFDGAAVLDHGNILDEVNHECGDVRVLYTNIAGGNLLAMAKSTGMAIIDLSVELMKERPDAVVVIADRYESLAAAISVRYLNIPLIHVQGGEITGSIDNSVRNAITKLANVHVVSNQDCAERVVKMGEKTDNVFVTGCPTLDICRTIWKKSASRLLTSGFTGDYEKRFVLGARYIIVAFHPVTTVCEMQRNERDFSAVLSAIEMLDVQAIWMYPNIDAGGDLIRKKIAQFKAADQKGKIHFFKHFETKSFLSLLGSAACIVGNSSVGIREASFIGIPSVNIGDRQTGRKRCKNVIDCLAEKGAIERAVKKQMAHGKYPPSHYYGDGFSGKRIAQVLRSCKLSFNKEG